NQLRTEIRPENFHIGFKARLAKQNRNRSESKILHTVYDGRSCSTCVAKLTMALGVFYKVHPAIHGRSGDFRSVALKHHRTRSCAEDDKTSNETFLSILLNADQEIVTVVVSV